MTKLVEITRIRQEVREPDVALETTHITSPEDAFLVARRFIQDDDREVFLVILLNTKNRVIAVHRAHVGSINSSIIHPREIFKSAILNNATSLIVSHQHPSGDPKPSLEDIEVTERLQEVGRIIGIKLLDHIVVGAGDDYVSLKAQGLL
nr:DNA repair protein RadC [Exiguobacterium sp. ERU656]